MNVAGINLAQALLLGYLIALTLGPVIAGRAIRVYGGRCGHRVALATIALGGVALGVWAYSGRVPGVRDSQALVGGLLAAVLLVTAPGALYLELGYRIGSRLVAAVIWLAVLVPMLIYLFISGVEVFQKIECPPGEACPIFS